MVVDYPTIDRAIHIPVTAWVQDAPAPFLPGQGTLSTPASQVETASGRVTLASQGQGRRKREFWMIVGQSSDREWADEPSVYASCPVCGLVLADESGQRDKRCPECLRLSGEAVLMRLVTAGPTAEGFRRTT